MIVANLARTDISGDFPKAVIHDDLDHGPYDVIVTRDYLSAREIGTAVEDVKSIAQNLIPGGRLFLAEPSAEWAAQEIKASRISVPLMMHIYGSAEHPRRQICSLEELRDITLLAGLVPEQAVTRAYVIAKDDLGNEFRADQHLIVVIRPMYAHEAEEKAWTPD